MRDVVGLTLFTYDRLDYAKRTLAAAAKYLVSPWPIWCHIASDGDPDEYVVELLSLAHSLFGEDQVSLSTTARRGYGASYNASTMVTHSIADILLPLEDDWELQRPLDIGPMIETLQDGDIGCIRMGYIGYTQQLRGEFAYRHGHHYLKLDPDSPEPHVFSGGPRLETRSFEVNVGLWPEGLHAGETEFEVAHRREAREGIAWPIDLIAPRGDAFAHIGTRVVKDAPLAVLEGVMA